MINYRVRFISSIAFMALLLSMSFSINSQELVQRKHGSVMEQINQSPLFNDNVSPEVAQLLDYASMFKGTRYAHGAAGPSGFDCSGFTSYVYASLGISLSRSSSAQYMSGTPVSYDKLKPGDLVFFNGRARGSRVGHVGIVTAVNGGEFQFIHASSTGVKVSNSSDKYYRARYVGARRVLPTKD